MSTPKIQLHGNLGGSNYDHIITTPEELLNLPNLEGRVLVKSVDGSFVFPCGTHRTIQVKANLLAFEGLFESNSHDGVCSTTFRAAYDGGKHDVEGGTFYFRDDGAANIIAFNGFDKIEGVTCTFADDFTHFITQPGLQFWSCGHVSNSSFVHASDCRVVEHCKLVASTVDVVVTDCIYVNGLEVELDTPYVDRVDLANTAVLTACKFVSNVSGIGVDGDCELVDYYTCPYAIKPVGTDSGKLYAHRIFLTMRFTPEQTISETYMGFLLHSSDSTPITDYAALYAVQNRLIKVRGTYTVNDMPADLRDITMCGINANNMKIEYVTAYTAPLATEIVTYTNPVSDPDESMLNGYAFCRLTDTVMEV